MLHNYSINPPIGIDLGTSNSVIAKYVVSKQKNGAFVYNHGAIANPNDDNLLQSSIYLEDNEDGTELIVGRGAELGKYKLPENYIKAVKRKIADNAKNLKLGNHTYSSIELSSEIIKALFSKPIQEEHDFQPAGIVVSVPYYFENIEFLNTSAAVELAINSIYPNYDKDKAPLFLGLIPEPVAAAINFVIENKDQLFNEKHVVVFDMGGGTLDITIFKLAIDAKVRFEVMISDGNKIFGGEDLDDILMNYIEEHEGVKYSEIKTERLIRRQKLKIREHIQEAKERLSTEKSIDLIISNLPSGQSIEHVLKRETFNKLLAGDNFLNRNFGNEVSEILESCLKKSLLQSDDIDLVLLIGGSSKIPFFQSILRNSFKSCEIINNDDAIKYGVAKGAAYYAAYILDRDFGHTHMPLGKDIQYKDVNIVLKTTHHIGVEEGHGKFSIIIPANSNVPAKAKKHYSPTAFKHLNNKEIISLNNINIYQGFNKNSVINNSIIGEIKLPDIYTHGRNFSEIKITIEFEATEIFIYAHVFIPKASKDESDVDIKNKIQIK